jgi:hypothetical protein
MNLTEILATIYLTYSLTSTIGPLGVFDWIRERWPHDSVLGFFHCPWCMSFWVSVIVIAPSIELSEGRLGLLRILATAFLGGFVSWGINFTQDVVSQVFFRASLLERLNDV